jgi:hypothetical protein
MSPIFDIFFIGRFFGFINKIIYNKIGSLFGGVGRLVPIAIGS